MAMPVLEFECSVWDHAPSTASAELQRIFWPYSSVRYSPLVLRFIARILEGHRQRCDPSAQRSTGEERTLWTREFSLRNFDDAADPLFERVQIIHSSQEMQVGHPCCAPSTEANSISTAIVSVASPLVQIISLRAHATQIRIVFSGGIQPFAELLRPLIEIVALFTVVKLFIHDSYGFLTSSSYLAGIIQERRMGRPESVPAQYAGRARGSGDSRPPYCGARDSGVGRANR